MPSFLMCDHFGNFVPQLELVPLIVKVAAINRLTKASNRLKRITVDRMNLFVFVAGVVGLVVCYMAFWTAFDPPDRQGEYELTEKVTMNGETVVELSFHCASESGVWRYISVVWHALLLLTATVLAFQTRNVRDEFNESRILAILIYSHFVFVLLRVAIFGLEDSLGYLRSARLISMVASCDVIATCFIYFLPKFLLSNDDGAFGSSNA